MLQTATHYSDRIGTDSQLDVELRKVFKVFNGETAVRGVDLDVRRGEFFSILGPSGCGKTTTLRLVAGFETLSAGEVLIRGQSMTRVPPYLRPVNTVFQSYALFSHLNVRDNIAFGLRLKRLGKSEIEEKVQEALKLVKMEAFASRFPSQMSGGQQQRVALARALVNRPAVLLLDEPLGALDLKLRKQMQVELSNLHKNLGLTFIMVTHDQEEAMSLSDRIAVMHEGRIEQIGTPSEIYESPQTPFVADFIGDTNLFSGRVEATDGTTQRVVSETGLKIVVSSSTHTSAGSTKIHKGDPVVVSVRPEKISISMSPVETVANCFKGRLINTMYLGTHLQFIVQLVSGEQLMVQQSKTDEAIIEVGETPVYVSWKPTDCLALSQEMR